MRIDAVVFDFFGTLTPGRSVAAQTAARREQAEALGVDPVEYDRMLSETYRERFRGVAGGRHSAWDGDVIASLTELPSLIETLRGS